VSNKIAEKLIFSSLLLLIPLTISKHLLANENKARNNISHERLAYETALAYRDAERWSQNSHTDAIWTNSLRILAESSSKEGDIYLSKLAFLVMDGGAAEDFGCAISHRLATHGQSFVNYLKQSRDDFENATPCFSSKHVSKRNNYQMNCISKSAYNNLVADFASGADKPEDNSEVDCSYMFK
jgi:hypothetical protein